MKHPSFVITCMLGALLGTALPGTAQPADNSAEPTAVGAVKKVATQVGQAVERGVKAAASGVERGAQAAARGVKAGVHAAASGVEKGAKATARVAEGVASKVQP